MRLNGIGLTLLGVGRQETDNTAFATLWFTFLYLPIIPFQRWRVQFLPHSGSGFSYKRLARLPLDGPDILRTYFVSWLVIPAGLLGPLVLAVREVWGALGLPAAWNLPYIGVAILWLVAGIWKLADWHENSCRPHHS
jgi:hypothetical protein